MERYQPDQYGRMMPDAHGQWVSLRAAELTALDAAQKSSANAQATIAALQAQLKRVSDTAIELFGSTACESHREEIRQEGAWDFFQKEKERGCVRCLTDQLTQRTAELEAANQQVVDERNLSNSWMKKHDELLAKVHKSGQFGAVVVQDVLKERDTLQAELECVRGQYEGMLAMVKALPLYKDISVSHRINEHEYESWHVWADHNPLAECDTEEEANAIKALYEHRRGMEGV